MLINANMRKKLMPNIKVPAKSVRSKVTVNSYIENELNKRVKATIHLPNNDKRKYKVDSNTNYNNSIKRIKEGGQYTLSQLLPPLKPELTSTKSPPTGTKNPTSTAIKPPPPPNKKIKKDTKMSAQSKTVTPAAKPTASQP